MDLKWYLKRYATSLKTIGSVYYESLVHPLMTSVTDTETGSVVARYDGWSAYAKDREKWEKDRGRYKIGLGWRK